MKKLLLLTSAWCLLGAYSASAEVNLSVGVGVPAYPVYYDEPHYVVAPDYPSYHYDHRRHFHDDYWAHHYERDHDDRDHDRGHDRDDRWHH